MLCSWLVLALVAAAQGRAVNISNTWVLPEEGFPVFYRYFRDRISWYEADAVCQFHHANLVTVDTTAQYDAVRAYLKELDISSAVWVGLIRSNPDGDFTWTDYRGLSGDGYWSSAPDARSAPLCAASDPAADYRWEARACGGPSIASFICELPVPQWALGNEGCMIRALPALTVLYLPESAAVQLTADCGLAGVKRVQCTGNVKHEDLIRDLSCTEDVESSPPTSMLPTIATWVTTEADQETSDVTNEENITTEHEDGIYTTNSIISTPNLFKTILATQKKTIAKQQPALSYDNSNILNKNINLDMAIHNNLQRNDIPNLVNHDDFHSTEQLAMKENEKHMQHKLLHNELARLGNYENIFSQPTDHFVPPLVMAKAKVNDDMTAVSFEEKLAQQHSEYRLIKYENENNDTLNEKIKNDNVETTTEVPSILLTTEASRLTDMVKDRKKDFNKHILPKKYDQTSAEVKAKARSPIAKPIKSARSVTNSPPTETTIKGLEETTLKNIVYFDSSNEDSTLDLTVVIKEPVSTENVDSIHFNISGTTNITNGTKYDTSIVNTSKSVSTTQATLVDNESSTESNIMQNITLNDEIIKITFIHDAGYPLLNATVFEITTRTPIFKDNSENSFYTSAHVVSSTENTSVNNAFPRNISNIDEIPIIPVEESNDTTNTTDTELILARASNKITEEISDSEVTTHQYLTVNTHGIENNINATEVTPKLIVKETINNITESEGMDYFDKSYNYTSEDMNDFQSPLLSGANEPLHKPNRSRRPQQPNNIKKFNPFRILG